MRAFMHYCLTVLKRACRHNVGDDVVHVNDVESVEVCSETHLVT